LDQYETTDLRSVRLCQLFLSSKGEKQACRLYKLYSMLYVCMYVCMYIYISNCTYKHNIRCNFWLHLMVCWVLERSNVLSKQVQGNDYDELAFLAQFGVVLRLSRPRERPGGNRQHEVENERHIDCCSNIGNDCTSIILSWGNGRKHDPLATILRRELEHRRNGSDICAKLIVFLEQQPNSEKSKSSCLRYL
jgi:hypothetical protein